MATLREAVSKVGRAVWRGGRGGLAAFAVLLLAVCLASCATTDRGGSTHSPTAEAPWRIPAGVSQDVLTPGSADPRTVPAYDGTAASVEIDGNVPGFTASDAPARSFEYYGDLDELGRCTYAVACVGSDLFPTGPRENISHIKPTGWRIAKYDFIDGQYLFNRCHLIARKLTGEDANERNLVTGTRAMNTDGMGPYEDLVHEYVRETGNHVLYRVTPVYAGSNPLAAGVQMEAVSVEDGGRGICFNAFVYNVQPRVGIDYATGKNWLLADGETPASPTEGPASDNRAQTAEGGHEDGYVLNTGSRKFHYPWCDAVQAMEQRNRLDFDGTRDEALAQGFAPCGTCNP